MAMILYGDAVSVLHELPDSSVQMVVTSPPYYGLRDYGVEGQIGLEPTPGTYVESLVGVFREVRRVLRDDGTLWLNLGDSYAGSGKGGNPEAGKQATNRGSQSIGVLYGKSTKQRAEMVNPTKHVTGVKSKDLIGIPWIVAIALRAAGWYLRADIIWSKPNPMPESVKDRPTRAHEYLFLLSKSPTYYYDADAIKEPYAESTLREVRDGYTGQATKAYAGTRAQDPSMTKRRIIDGIRRKNDASIDRRKCGFQERWDTSKRDRPRANARAAGDYDFRTGTGRNKRDVWTIANQPFKGAHFATFPEALVEPCVLAGSRAGDVVLDPFCGSGRAGIVALRHGREFIGIDLNPEYCLLAMEALDRAQERIV